MFHPVVHDMTRPADDAANGVFINRLAGTLMGAAQERVRRRSNAQPFGRCQIAQGRGLVQCQNQWFFRIGVFASLKDLARDRIMHRGDRQVDHHIDVIRRQQTVNRFRTYAEFFGLCFGRIGVDVRDGAHFKRFEQGGPRSNSR